METLKADRLVTINVDVQKDFCPGGALAVAHGDDVITPLNALNRFTRERGGLVIATGDQHPKNTPHFDKWPVHCVAGTDGAEFHPRLHLTRKDVIINKGMGQTDGYSGFEGYARDGQTIEQLIRPVDRERVAVLIGGLATDYCDLNTVLDALKVNPGKGTLDIFAVKDAMRAVNIKPDDGARALWRMQNAGAHLVHSTDILNGYVLEIA